MVEHPEVRTAIYTRVSTREEDHNIEAQLEALRQYAESKGWTVTKEYVENASGASLSGRKAWGELMDQMRSGSIDVVAVLMLDQVSRSTKDALNTLAELAEHSVGFVEVDGYIDTTTVTGKLILKVRELECNRRSALIREGMARAKAEGKRVGQPPAADPEGSGTPAVTMPTEASQT